MAINETTDYRRSSLTQQQIHEAESAIYGLPQNAPPSFDIQSMTPEQIEFLRTVLAQHDSQRNQVNEFDLNKPPVKPYRYQEFPRMIYHHEKREYLIVQNADQLQLWLGRGYRLEPYVAEVDNSPALDMATVAETRALDAQARRPREEAIGGELQAARFLGVEK